MKQTVAVASGYWQILQVAASLLCKRGRTGDASPAILLLFNGNGHLSVYDSEIQAFARKCFPWAEVYWVSNIIIPEMSSEGAVSYGVSAFREFCHKMDLEPENLWLTGIHRQYEKIVMAACPCANVYIYEDGLASYYEHGYTCGVHRFAKLPIWRWPGALRREISHRSSPECVRLLGVCARDISRVRSAYLSLLSLLPLPEYLRDKDVVDMSDDLKKLIGIMSEDVTPFYDSDAQNATVLVLGNPMYQTKKISWENELEIYAGIICSIMDAGYCVIWKDHPRGERPFYEALCSKTGIALTTCNPRISVELLIPKHNIKAVVANVSTSLFNAQVLFDLPCFTYYEKEWGHYFGVYDAWTANLVSEHIPSYKDMSGLV